MITEKDLQEAIAECEGVRNPNANTCIKLAAFYTIKEHMFGKPEPEPYSREYSYASGKPGQEAEEVRYDSHTEFSGAVNGKEIVDVLKVMDELMSTLAVVQPRLYAGVMRKIKGITS